MVWQVLFLLYHYFNAREIYNAIRVFIAGLCLDDRLRQLHVLLPLQGLLPGAVRTGRCMLQAIDGVVLHP